MIYSVLITHERNPDVFVATIPAFDLVTQGSSKQAAIRAAKEAIVRELRGRAYDREPSPIEASDYADLVRVQIDPDDAVTESSGIRETHLEPAASTRE